MSIYRFTEFTNAQKGTTTGEGQSSSESFLVQARGVQVYRQGQCNLSLSSVDEPNFRKFMAVVDERYCSVSRCTVTRQLSERAADKDAKCPQSQTLCPIKL